MMAVVLVSCFLWEHMDERVLLHDSDCVQDLQFFGGGGGGGGGGLWVEGSCSCGLDVLPGAHLRFGVDPHAGRRAAGAVGERVAGTGRQATGSGYEVGGCGGMMVGCWTRTPCVHHLLSQLLLTLKRLHATNTSVKEVGAGWVERPCFPFSVLFCELFSPSLFYF